MVFGKRPLGATGSESPPSSDPWGNDALDLEKVHEQVFYTDKDGNLKNIGFFKGGKVDGVIQADPNFPANIKSYRFGTMHHNVGIENLNFSPKGFSADKYNFIFNNCQDYCSAIRKQLD